MVEGRDEVGMGTGRAVVCEGSTGIAGRVVCDGWGSVRVATCQVLQPVLCLITDVITMYR